MAAPMRADARRNRQLILAAAEEAFAAEGLNVPVDEIARRAGVGAGTLYRHFPTKEALFEAVVVDHMVQLASDARAMASSTEPGQALFDFLGRMADEAATKRNLMDALMGAGIDIKETAATIKGEVEAAVGALLSRAQDAGQVRGDVQLADLFGLIMGTCAMAAENDACSQARMFAIVCAGLRVPT